MAMSTRSLRSSRLRPFVAAGVVVVLWAAVGTILPAQSAQQLYLTVLDDDGNPVVDLRPHEISVAENGVRCEVLYLARPSGPADVSILVDTSEAVVPSTTHVRRALTEFVDALDGYARMSLMDLRRPAGARGAADHPRQRHAGRGRPGVSGRRRDSALPGRADSRPCATSRTASRAGPRW